MPFPSTAELGPHPGAKAGQGVYQGVFGGWVLLRGTSPGPPRKCDNAIPQWAHHLLGYSLGVDAERIGQQSEVMSNVTLLGGKGT